MRQRKIIFLCAALFFLTGGQGASSAEACRKEALASVSQLMKERMPPRLSQSECGVFVQDAGFGYDIDSSSRISDLVARVRAVLSLPFVKGVSVHLNWRAFAPADPADAFDATKYHFEAFNAAIAAAQEAGKNVSLNLSTASYAPAYVLQECPSFHFVHPLAWVGLREAPIPWTECYHKYFDAAVTALAHTYDGNPTVRYVSINGPSTLFGIETNWPMRRGSLRPKTGYESTFTLDSFASEWKRSIDQFVTKFPRTQLALALNDSITIAPDHEAAVAAVREIRDYAIGRYAHGTQRSDKRIIIRLLGLNDSNPVQFRGPNECSGRNANDYVSLAWDRRDAAKIAFEWGGIARRAHKGAWTPNTFTRAFFNGISWGASEIDLKLPDVWDRETGAPYAEYVNAIAAEAAVYNHCGE